MQPGIMADGNFNHPEPGPFEFLGHLDADDAASGLEGNRVKDAAAEKTKITIDIPDRKAEYQPHHPPVQLANPDSIPGVGPLHLVTIDEIDVWADMRKQVVDFTDIVLAVAIRIENKIFSGVLETGDQSGAIAAIPIMMNDTQTREFCRQSIENRSRSVVASIVDNEYLEVVRYFLQFVRSSTDDTLDGVLIVVCREEGSD